MLVVAEEPGIGLGAGLAGLDGVDPGAGSPPRRSCATASFGKHDFPLWQVDSPDRAVFAGEIKGHWLWVVLWPETAGILLIEPIALRDLRDPWQDLDLPFGAPSLPRLPASCRPHMGRCAPTCMCTATPPTGRIPRPRSCAAPRWPAWTPWR